MEWQPIETAPKDGTAVILYAPERKLGNSGTCYQGELIYSAFYSTEQNDWMVVDKIMHHIHFLYQPTHWMPLPKPPQQVEKEGV